MGRKIKATKRSQQNAMAIHYLHQTATNADDDSEDPYLAMANIGQIIASIPLDRLGRELEMMGQLICRFRDHITNDPDFFLCFGMALVFYSEHPDLDAERTEKEKATYQIKKEHIKEIVAHYHPDGLQQCTEGQLLANSLRKYVAAFKSGNVFDKVAKTVDDDSCN